MSLSPPFLCLETFRSFLSKALVKWLWHQLPPQSLWIGFLCATWSVFRALSPTYHKSLHICSHRSCCLSPFNLHSCYLEWGFPSTKISSQAISGNPSTTGWAPYSRNSFWHLHHVEKWRMQPTNPIYCCPLAISTIQSRTFRSWHQAVVRNARVWGWEETAVCYKKNPILASGILDTP